MITLLKADATSAVYAPYRIEGDRAVYTGPLASDIVSDKLIIKSTAPKRNGLNLGNRRSDINLITSTSVLDGAGATVVRDRKLALVSSVPVGTTATDVAEDVARMKELLNQPDIVEQILLTGKIEVSS
jgi:hypothetical protein